MSDDQLQVSAHGPSRVATTWVESKEHGKVYIQQEGEATISVRASTTKISVISTADLKPPKKEEQHVKPHEKEQHTKHQKKEHHMKHHKNEQHMKHHKKEEDSSMEAAKKPKNGPAEEETNEDIYCSALAQTLHHLAPPVTVGFYGERVRNKQMLLDTIQAQLRQKSEQNKYGKEEARTLRSLFSLFWHMMFYLPVSSSTKPPNVRYLFINFNAWEYAGSNHTWVGLVMTLLDEIEGSDIVPFSIFRAYGGKFKEVPGTPKKKWVRNPRSRLFVFYLFVMFGAFTLSVLLLVKILGYNAMEIVEGAVAVLFLALFFPVGWATKNMYFTLKKELQKKMGRKGQLGLMHSAKQEVETIIKYLQFMAFHEEREMRVVLKIINLDLCAPDKVMGVLNAISNLFSDRDAPFISIVAADPSVLVECIQWSSNASKNGYLYLDQVVTLPFSLPQMSDKAKRQLLQEILNPPKRREEASEKSSKTLDSRFTIEDIQTVFQYLSSENYSEYIPGNSIQLKRVVYTALTILSMIRLGFKPRGRTQADQKEERANTREVIDWVILANCWPCRLSWILQCEEDVRRQRKNDQRGAAATKKKQKSDQREEEKKQQQEAERKGLLALYEEHAGELDRIKFKIKKLLELDQNPELFRTFLQRNHFTVERAEYFGPLLTNLDCSLRRQFTFFRHLDSITGEQQSSARSPSTEKVVAGRSLKKFPSEQEENKKPDHLPPSHLNRDVIKDQKGSSSSVPALDPPGNKNKLPLGAKTWKLNIYN